MAISGGPTGRTRYVTWNINFHISADFLGDPNSYAFPFYTYNGGWPDGTKITGGQIENLLGCTLSAQGLAFPSTPPTPGSYAAVEYVFQRIQGNEGSDNIRVAGVMPAGDYQSRGTLTVTIPVYQNVYTGPMPGTTNLGGEYGLIVQSKAVAFRQPQNDYQLCPFNLSWGTLNATGNFLLAGPIFDLGDVILSGNCLGFGSTVSFTATCSSQVFGYPYSTTVTKTISPNGHPLMTVGTISYYTGASIGADLSGGVTLYDLYNVPPFGFVLLPTNYPITFQFGYSQAVRNYTVTGDFRCFNDEYPDTWSVLYNGAIPGGGSKQLQGTKTQSATFQQNQVGSNIPGFPSVSGFDFVRVTPDPAMKDQGYGSIYGTSGPPMGKALVWNAVNLSCSNNIDFWPDHWQSVGGTAVASLPSKKITLSKGTNNLGLSAKGTFNTDFLIAYRWLKFDIDSLNQATQVVVSMNGKTFTIPLAASGTIIVDLTLPDDAAFNFQDSMGPFLINGSLLEPTSMTGRWGLKWTNSITLNFNTQPNQDGTSSITISNMKLYQNSQPRVEMLKAFTGVSPYVTATVQNQVIQESWQRGICAIVDGMMAWEYGSWFSQGPTQLAFKLSDWCAYVSSIPGWSMSLVDPGQSFTATGLTECDELGGGGYIYPSEAGGSLTIGKTANDYTSYSLPEGGAVIPASLFFNYFYSDPGEGDVDTGVGYGNNSAPSIYRFMGHVKGKGWGIANPAYIGKSIQLISDLDGSVGGNAVINPDGTWETGLPYCKDGVVYDVLLNGKKGGTIGMHGARRNAISRLQVATLGVALENGLIGYWKFEAGTMAGFVVYRSWDANQFEDFVVIDSAADASEPATFYRPTDRLLGCLYRRGSGTSKDPYTIWQATSSDEGSTWSTVQIMSGYSHARKLFNPRTQEFVSFVIDSDNLLQSRIDDAYGSIVQYSPTDKSGILQATCSDTTFDVVYTQSKGFLDVYFVDATGTARLARSQDEGRSYYEIFNQ